jgi:phage-related protein
LSSLWGVLLANPIGIVIAVVAALVAAFIHFWNTSEEFRQFWIDLWETIKTTAMAVWDALKEFFQTAWETIVTIATTIWNGLKEFFSELWAGIQEVFSTVLQAIVTIVTTYFTIYQTIITTVLGAIRTVASTIWAGIRTVFSVVLKGIVTIVKTYFLAYRTIVVTVLTAIKTVVTISAILWSGMLNIEHGVFLVLMTAVFWLMRGKPNFRLLAGCGVSAVAMLISPFNITAPFGCMLLYLYNGEKGDSNRVINLLCYPLMLLAAGVASLYL